jgi:hypothetical protein
MTRRRVLTFLLCIFGAYLAGTGIVLLPKVYGETISNDELWGFLHYQAAICMFILVCIHLFFSRRPLRTYWRRGRIIGTICFTLAGVLLISIPLYHYGVIPIGQPSTQASFPEDFESGEAVNWELDSGWYVEKIEEGNHVLVGSGYFKWAKPKVEDWSDYTIEAKFRLINGNCHLNFRNPISEPGKYRYVTTLSGEGISLERAIDEDWQHLANFPASLDSEIWHQLKIVLQGNNIAIYLDNDLALEYTDIEHPLLSGGFSLETFKDSMIYFDDINLIVEED